jgi:hypothetical protein
MNHRATPRFWSCYHRLPEEIQRLADRCYQLLRNDPRHPFLNLKQVGPLWSARVGLHYRALAVEDGADLLWVWIGTHSDYDRLVQAGRS